MEPCVENEFLAGHVEQLLTSYRRLTGRDLLPPGVAVQRAQALYETPLVVVSHGTEAEPVFNYANLAAQALFEMDWDTFVTVPSRLSAGPVHRAERERLLDEVTRRGYIDNYAGIRVARSGRQFRIERAVVWNVSNGDGAPAGQAAAFSDWS
jgi:hypothetical protein